MSYGLPPLAAILCLHTAGLRRPRFEALLWAYLIVQTAFPIWGATGQEWRLAWEAANTALLLTGAAIVIVYAKRPLRWAVNVQILTLFAMAALMFSEFMRYLGWVDIESPIVRHYHAPLMIVGIGAAVFEYHVLAVWRAQKLNLELERRVAEKAREIETNHARVAEAMREQALAQERQRIVTDMHDGLGASLIALLRYAQATRADPEIELRVKEALQELRIAIDALEPYDGDLAAVLGNLRYRLEPLLEGTGVQLEWQVATLPRIESLEPSAVFVLQRILLEGFAHALRHARATRMRLSAQAAANGGIEIRVEDDGPGPDPTQPAAGPGMSGMHARAARLGARLEVASRSGSGTVVRLLIPRVLPGLSEDTSSSMPDLRAPHDLGPAPGVA
jgi:signal transduction histidine kinase